MYNLLCVFSLLGKRFVMLFIRVELFICLFPFVAIPLVANLIRPSHFQHSRIYPHLRGMIIEELFVFQKYLSILHTNVSSSFEIILKSVRSMGYSFDLPP